MKTFDTVTGAVSDLRLRGYAHNFTVNKDCLFCDENAVQLKPEQFVIHEVYRFEGDSDPGDESVVYAVSSIDNSVKGILVLAYGAYAEEVSPELLQKLGYNPKADLN
ncbi:MAG: phosphoribosylpyrophosphate synthetase [Chitinophagales bacterium]